MFVTPAIVPPLHYNICLSPCIIWTINFFNSHLYIDFPPMCVFTYNSCLSPQLSSKQSIYRRWEAQLLPFFWMFSAGIILRNSLYDSPSPPHYNTYHLNNQFIADGSLNCSAGSLFAASPLPSQLHLFYTKLWMHLPKKRDFLEEFFHHGVVVVWPIHYNITKGGFFITLTASPLFHQVMNAPAKK